MLPLLRKGKKKKKRLFSGVGTDWGFELWSNKNRPVFSRRKWVFCREMLTPNSKTVCDYGSASLHKGFYRVLHLSTYLYNHELWTGCFSLLCYCSLKPLRSALQIVVCHQKDLRMSLNCRVSGVCSPAPHPIPPTQN